MDAVGSSRVRVALVAPHPIPRAALRSLLESALRFEIVGEGQTVSEVLGLQPEVLLIDTPPNSDPAPIIGSAARDVAIVILLDEKDLPQCSAAIAAGAAGLVGRQRTPQALFAAIDRVRGGGTSIDRSILLNVVRNKASDGSSDRFGTLSKREGEVHALVAEGLKNKEIARRLFISEATVRHHLTSIFGKLGVSGRLEMIALHWRRTSAAEPVRSG